MVRPAGVSTCRTGLRLARGAPRYMLTTTSVPSTADRCDSIDAAPPSPAPVEHADPVAQQERCEARAQAGGEPGGQQPGRAAAADPVAADGGHGGPAAAGHEQPRAGGRWAAAGTPGAARRRPGRADGECSGAGQSSRPTSCRCVIRSPVTRWPLRMRTGTAMRGVSVASCSASSSRLLRQSSASDRKEITSGMVRAL